MEEEVRKWTRKLRNIWVNFTHLETVMYESELTKRQATY